MLSTICGNTISTLISIIIGAVSYVIAIMLLKVLSKEDIMMIPFGSKLYPVLVKMGVYKEE